LHAVKQAERELRLIADGNGDPDDNHVAADRVLCRLLRNLVGARAEKLLSVYESIEKWYA